MPKFAANLTFLFTELDFPARFQAAADAGPPVTIDPDTGIQYAELVYPGKGATPERVEHLEKHGYVILVRSPELRHQGNVDP